MTCSDVGLEVWPVFLVAGPISLIALLVPRSLQRWLRERRPGTAWASAIPEPFYRESGVWAIRALGIIPTVIWLASLLGVYCYFNGPG